MLAALDQVLDIVGGWNLPLKVLLVSSLLVFTACSYLWLASRNAKLSHIPGPWIARYTDAWALYNSWRILRARQAGGPRNDSPRHRALQKRYGDVVRVGPRSVLVYDARAVPVIYSLRSRLEKSDAYTPFRPPGITTSLVSIQDESTHARYRKLVSNAYSLSSIKHYEPCVDDMVKRFNQVCTDHAQRNEPLNLTLWSYYYCFDVVSKLTLGVPLGFMEGEGKDVYSLIQAVKAFGRRVVLVSQMPWLHKVVTDNALMRKAKPSPFLMAARRAVVARLQHPDPKGDRPDLLSHFVATHGAQPDLMDLKQVMVSASGNLAAGGFSPGVVFDTLCRFLVRCPEAQEKLFAELQGAHVPVLAPFNQIRALPYLEGVIREAQRLHLGSAFILQRVTGQAGLDLPNGVHLPPGTKVGCPAEAVNKDPVVFGSDPQEYRPERWMRKGNEDVDAFERRRNLMDQTELTFGQGSRTCIGKNVFSLEVFKVLVSLMLQFQFEIAPSQQGADLFVTVHRRADAKAEL